MDKQRAVNTVTANDEYSKQLMKMYENWMGGECFQGSNIKEEEIPTGPVSYTHLRAHETLRYLV